MISLIRGIKNGTNQLIYKTYSLKDIENKLIITGQEERGINEESGMNRCALPYVK